MSKSATLPEGFTEIPNLPMRERKQTLVAQSFEANECMGRPVLYLGYQQMLMTESDHSMGVESLLAQRSFD